MYTCIHNTHTYVCMYVCMYVYAYYIHTFNICVYSFVLYFFTHFLYNQAHESSREKKAFSRTMRVPLYICANYFYQNVNIDFVVSTLWVAVTSSSVRFICLRRFVSARIISEEYPILYVHTAHA